MSRRSVLSFVPAAIAVYELRFLIAHARHACAVLLGVADRVHSFAPLALILLTAAAVLILREAGRGLGARFRLRPPTRSVRLLGSWLLCASALAAVVCTVELAHAATGPVPGHGLMPGDWGAAVPAIVFAGLLLAVSLHGARWLLVRVGRSRSGVARPRPVRLRFLFIELGATAAPLRAGWSDRGPPVFAPAV